MLYIVCKDSERFRDTIKTIFENKIGYFNYEIVDPKYHETDRSYSTVIMLDDLDLKLVTNKTFRTLAPLTTLSLEEKKKVIEVFKEAVAYDQNHSIKKEVLQNDIPRFADLEQFLLSFKGQVMELKLQDGRLIGIYPDKDKLQMKYSNEYHVSTIINLAKLQDVLGYTKLSIKDL